MSKIAFTLVCILVVAPAITGSAFAFEMEPYKIEDDIFYEMPLYDCFMNYFYYIPSPTASWFWGVSGWEPGSTVGAFFRVGDISMFTGCACDPLIVHTVEHLQVLDFAGYGAAYPGLHTVDFEIYCSDAAGCPTGVPLWTSGPVETEYGWNFIELKPLARVESCYTHPGPPALAFDRFLVVARHIGSDCTYPKWGFDNISSPVAAGAEMHDLSCFPAVYPRPYDLFYTTVHSGYYGVGFEHCPPVWIADGADTSGTGETYGYLELAWRVFLLADWGGPTEASTWGALKAMYR